MSASPALLTAAAPSAGGGVRRLPAGRGAAPAAAGFRGVDVGFTFTCLSTTMAPPLKPKVAATAAVSGKVTATAAVHPNKLVRIGKGYSVLGFLRFKPASPTMDLPSRSFVKTRCCFGDEEQEKKVNILVWRLDDMSKWLGNPIHREELTHLSMGEAEFLLALRKIAMASYKLVKDISTRTKAEPGSALFEGLLQIGIDFLGMRRQVVFPVDLSLLIVAKLDNLRRIISYACATPLPLIIGVDEFLPGDSLEEEIVYLVKRFYHTIEDDVKAMISTSYEKEVARVYAELAKEMEYFSTFGDEDGEFDKYYAALCKQTEEAMTGRFIILPLEVPFELSEEESALQSKLKEIAERCMDLQADAMRRLRPEQRLPLYLVFRTTHLALTSVKVRAMEGHANLGVSSLLIVHKLGVVRKMVSSACSAALPLDRDNQELSLLPPVVQEAVAGLVGVNSNPHEVALAFIEYTYNTVKSDIDEMITASAASAAS